MNIENERKKLIKRRKNPKTKIIFLDHDGVLVPKGFESDDYEFSQNCVYVLNEILLETNAEIVVSSDWRNHYTLQNLCEIYKNNEIIKCPIDLTVDFWTKSSSIKELENIRAKEILHWLDNHNVDKWVAIDDMNLPLSNFVLTDEYKGLAQKGVYQKILGYLK